MTAPTPEAPATEQDGGPGLLPFLLVFVSLLPNIGAAFPSSTYYFRDFSVTFYPIRLFAARELAEGRIPFWNPYINEGTFGLPTFYPVDLLHALLPGPHWVSWFLTLHYPLAALGAYRLARDLGCSRWGAFASGTLYSLGGFAQSCLNLYVFLQALALAPWLVSAFHRVARHGGRSTVWAALVLASSLSTLAIEFVYQGLVLAVLVAWITRKGRRSLMRVVGAIALGHGLCAVPISVMLGLLGETARGTGFERTMVLANAFDPGSLLQMIIPNVYGVLAAPAQSWWGRGFPYFVSYYTGAIALSLAIVGIHRSRLCGALLITGGMAFWYSLGERAGLCSWLTSFPGAQMFRYPSKAFFLVHIVVALLVGWGIDKGLRGVSQRLFAAVAASLIAAMSVLGLALHVSEEAWAWLGSGTTVVDARRFVFWDTVVSMAPLFLALISCALARKYPGARRQCVGALAVLLVLDLARAAHGMNPQASTRFFEALPEIRQERLDDLDGRRIFTYGLDFSPAIRDFSARPAQGRGLWFFFLSRQMLVPYLNVVDGVESSEGKDLTSFLPHPLEIPPEWYAPEQVERILPHLRNMSVSRVLSLDPLSHGSLRLRQKVGAGPPGLDIHVYELQGSWPRAYLACRAGTADSPEDALRGVFQPTFDPNRDVILPRSARETVSCTTGSVTTLSRAAGEEMYRVESDGSGYLVARSSYARGWEATVDGTLAPVHRANGKHQAVPVPGGEHEVLLRYRPPGLRVGLFITILAALGLAVLSFAQRPQDLSG